MTQRWSKWTKRTLVLTLLGILFGCSTNTYDHIGRSTVTTPYEAGRYQRVEDYLRQQGLLDPEPDDRVQILERKRTNPLPSDGLQPPPTLGPETKK